MKILIVRLSALGDVIHGLPCAARLKEAIPGVELTWLVEKPSSDVLFGNPAVDRVILFPKKEWKQQLRTIKGALSLPSATLGFASELQKHKFDAAIDLQGLLKSALLTVASGAPRRFGFKTGREGADLFLSDKLDVGDYFAHNVHVVDLNLRLAEFVIEKLCPLSDKQNETIDRRGDEPTLQLASQTCTSSDAQPGRAASGITSGLSGPHNCVSAGGSISLAKQDAASDSTPSPPASSSSLPDDPAASKTPSYIYDSMDDSAGDAPRQSSLQSEQSANQIGTSSLSASATSSSSYISRQTLFPLPAPSAEASTKVDAILNAGSSNWRKVALIPGTTWPSKIWPVEKWCELAAQLHARQCRIILIGGPSEITTNKIIADHLHERTTGETTIDLTAKTSLIDLVAVFQRVDLVIGADTGPMHLAAALQGVPVLGVFGSTPVGRNGPYGSHTAAVSLALTCQPCFKKNCPLGTTACLVDLHSDLVLARALQLMKS